MLEVFWFFSRAIVLWKEKLAKTYGIFSVFHQTYIPYPKIIILYLFNWMGWWRGEKKGGDFRKKNQYLKNIILSHVSVVLTGPVFWFDGKNKEHLNYFWKWVGSQNDFSHGHASPIAHGAYCFRILLCISSYLWSWGDKICLFSLYFFLPF